MTSSMCWCRCCLALFILLLAIAWARENTSLCPGTWRGLGALPWPCCLWCMLGLRTLGQAWACCGVWGDIPSWVCLGVSPCTCSRIWACAGVLTCMRDVSRDWGRLWVLAKCPWCCCGLTFTAWHSDLEAECCWCKVPDWMTVLDDSDNRWGHSDETLVLVWLGCTVNSWSSVWSSICISFPGGYGRNTWPRKLSISSVPSRTLGWSCGWNWGLAWERWGWDLMQIIVCWEQSGICCCWDCVFWEGFLGLVLWVSYPWKVPAWGSGTL